MLSPSMMTKSATPDDYHRKFELPYKPFLDGEAYFQSISRTGASVDAGVIRLARDKDRH